MLFLFDHTVFDLGDPVEVLSEPEFPLPLNAARALSIGQVLAVVRMAAFETPDFANVSGAKAKGLAALLATKSEANALRAYRPDDAQSATDVVTKLANAPLPTLADLFFRQAAGNRSPSIVDTVVWTRAAAQL
ncbi:MAG: hypothetical protein MI723_19185 [Caulobacterales bacterium]|nr:hypothetical protein [Caulobacterales bacterium]